MLEKYTDFFESQNDLFDISEIFEKMLKLSSAPYSTKAENDYVENGIVLAYAMFSNYDKLGDKARKSAVLYFIEEMHKAEETLPQASSRYTLAEEMNNKLIDYYEAENNPDTNDTVEDSIDELFRDIPLHHYLNAVFAKTESEFEDSLMKGLNASYNAFMNLPYANSMMGGIAVTEPKSAFAPYAPTLENTGNEQIRQDLMSELTQSGVKYNADDVILITKTPEGKLLWLEKGNSSTGLMHNESQFW